jgi:hypothetical protein
MVPTFKSKALITDLYSMNPPDNREGYSFLPLYRSMSHLLELDLENGISLVPAERRESVAHPPIVLLSHHHKENEQPISNVGFSC